MKHLAPTVHVLQQVSKTSVYETTNINQVSSAVKQSHYFNKPALKKEISL